MDFLVHSISFPGGRRFQEDGVVVSRAGEALTAIVADGMGSGGRGEEASQLAVNEISAALAGKAVDKKAVMQGFSQANRAVLDAQAAGQPMSSTAALLHMEEGRGLLAHVGNSRIYAFSGGRLVYQTLDHSVAQSAALQEEARMEIREHEDLKRLFRTLGKTAEAKPDIHTMPVQPHDAFLLCTDGFWQGVYELEMEVDLAKAAGPAQWISYMLGRVGSRMSAGHDNLSAIGIFCVEDAR